MPPLSPAPAPPLRLVFWETTQACNLACKHCRAEAKPTADSRELTTTEAKGMMDNWEEAGNPVLVLSGGEPLMRPDIFDLLAYGRELGIRMALATNGTLVSEEIAARLAAAGLHRVSISLDGPDAASHDGFRQTPGAFQASLEGIRRLVRLGVPVQINTSATAHNAGQLGEILALAEREKAVAWHLFMLVPVGCGLQIPGNQRLHAGQYEYVLRWFVEAQLVSPLEMKATCAPHVTRVAHQFRPAPASQGARPAHPSAGAGKGCLAGTGVCFVSHLGQVQGCGYLPLPAGNVRVQPLSQVWRHSRLFQDLRNPARLGGKCGRCDFASTCGGCRARAYSQAGDAFAEEPLCAYRPPSCPG